jgi:hypothetical protein
MGTDSSQVITWGGDLSLGTLWGSQCNWRRGGKVAGKRVQTTSLTLLSHSRLLLRPKLAVSREKMSGVNLALGKERTNYLIRYTM